MTRGSWIPLRSPTASHSASRRCAAPPSRDAARPGVRRAGHADRAAARRADRRLQPRRRRPPVDEGRLGHGQRRRGAARGLVLRARDRRRRPVRRRPTRPPTRASPTTPWGSASTPARRSPPAGSASARCASPASSRTRRRDDELETLRVLAAAITAHVELARRERERAEETGMLRRLGEATSRLARVSTPPSSSPTCAPRRAIWPAPTARSCGRRRRRDAARLGRGRARHRRRRAPARARRGVAAGVRPRRADLPHARRAARARRLGRRRCSSRWPPRAARGGRPDRASGTSEPAERPERELQLIELLSSEAAVAIERTTTLSELEKLTRVDALTGIGNRRAFDEQLVRELKRAEREGTPVALAMFDLDHFKAYNDTHGHPGGRPAADRGRRRLAGLPARDRQPRPLRRRGVRADRARLQRGGRGRARRPPARRGDRRPDLLGRRRVLGPAPRPPPSCSPAPTPRSTRPRSPAATAPRLRYSAGNCSSTH